MRGGGHSPGAAILAAHFWQEDGTLTRYGVLQHSSDGNTLCFSPTVGSVPLGPGEVLSTEGIIDAGANIGLDSSCATKTESCAPAACASGPCLNGGDCYDVISGEYKCLCTIDFTGEHCETAVITMTSPDFTATLAAGTPRADDGWYTRP